MSKEIEKELLGEELDLGAETEDSQGVLTIGALTELVFGYRSAADLRKDPDVCLGRELECELEKISPLSPVFLNEIV